MNANAISSGQTLTPVRPPSSGAMRKIENAVRNQSELARTAEVDRSHVCLMLAGKRNPSLEVAARIAGAIGVTLDDLYRYLRACTPQPAVN